MTISITTTYHLVWRYLDTEYCFTKDGRCFNIKRNCELKQTLVGSSKGYCLYGKFKTLKSIRDKLFKIQEQADIPF